MLLFLFHDMYPKGETNDACEVERKEFGNMCNAIYLNISIIFTKGNLIQTLFHVAVTARLYCKTNFHLLERRSFSLCFIACR
jgi:hypothetical protein